MVFLVATGAGPGCPKPAKKSKVWPAATGGGVGSSRFTLAGVGAGISGSVDVNPGSREDGGVGAGSDKPNRSNAEGVPTDEGVEAGAGA